MTTTPPTTPGAAEPLWTNKRIYDRATYHRDTTGLGFANGHWITSRELRDEYEAKLDEYQAAFLYYIELAERNEARIAELQSQLDAARAGQWMPLTDELLGALKILLYGVQDWTGGDMTFDQAYEIVQSVVKENTPKTQKGAVQDG